MEIASLDVTSCMTFPLKLVPWSVRIAAGGPMSRMIFKRLRAVSDAVYPFIGKANEKLVAKSIPVRMYAYPDLDLGRGPTTSRASF